jgi:formylmethanofuran dehydrogenase subunit D
MKNKTIKIFVFIVLVLSIWSNAFATPMKPGGEVGETITLPPLEIVGEIKGGQTPHHSKGCDKESGCNQNNQNKKESISPQLYLCIGINCNHLGNMGQKQGPSIVRVQDGKVVEQVRVTIDEELKEVADIEMSNQVVDDSQKLSGTPIQRTIKVRKGSTLNEEAKQISALLESAKNQLSDQNEKSNLAQVVSAALDYSKVQDSYRNLLSEKLQVLVQEKVAIQENNVKTRISTQKVPLDISPIPPEGKGAKEKLKNISRAIYNLAFAPAAVGSLYNPLKEETKALLSLVGDASTKMAPELVPGMLSAAASLQIIAVLFESSPVGVGSDVVPQEVLAPPLDPNDEKANELYNRAKNGDRSAKLEYLTGENEKRRVGIEKYGIKTKAGLIAYSRIHEAIKTLPGGLKVVRIREGYDSNKFAIIGRKMDIVNVVSNYLENFVEEMEVFCPSQEARDEYKKLVERNGREPTLEEQLKTRSFKENKVWAEKMIYNGFTVLDMGNPKNVQEMSPFYEMEKALLFNGGSDE